MRRFNPWLVVILVICIVYSCWMCGHILASDMPLWLKLWLIG